MGPVFLLHELNTDLKTQIFTFKILVKQRDLSIYLLIYLFIYLFTYLFTYLFFF